MKTAMALAAILTSIAAQPAVAQIITDTPSGPRIELRAGWDRLDLVAEARDGTNRVESSTGDSGVTYGTEIGYDYVHGVSVIGLYAGIAKSSLSTCEDLLAGATIYARECLKAGREISVGARVGFVTGTNALVYLKGGYSNAATRYDFEDRYVPAYSFRETETFDGFHLGAGGEAGFGRNAYGKLEYVYANYGGDRFDAGGTRIDTGIERHQVTAGLGYRF